MRGYKEKGNINTPMELAINNEIDRFSLAIDAIDRVPETPGDRRARQGEIPQPADRVPGLRYKHGIDIPRLPDGMAVPLRVTDVREQWPAPSRPH